MQAVLASNALIKVTPGLMIWTIVCFLIVLFVLKRWAFGPIQGVIDERRERIRRSLEEADNAREEARRLLEEHRQLIGQARGEAEEIRTVARHEADAQLRRVKEEAEEDRRRRLEDTRRQIEAETRRSLEQIRAEVAELSLVAAEKVTRGALNDKDQRRLIDEAIGELDFSVLERND
jgi:F-type H+-transporting ATPase subunit b